MKKILNFADNFVDESIEGIVLAHSKQIKHTETDIRAIVRSDAPVKNKVAIVTGGGYGHLPLFLGYVGQGLCDGCAVGNVFTSPSCETIIDVTRTVNSGNGVLYLFGNYMGDQMNFEMAAEIMREEGNEVEIIRAADDIASCPRDAWENRRGIAGILYAYRIAGALAEKGLPLNEVAEKTMNACRNIATLGFAFSSCQLPEASSPIFEISDEEMEMGMGIHGEKGIKRCNMLSAHELAEYCVENLIEDLNIAANDEVCVLVNGLGSTAREELYILFGEVSKILSKNSITVHEALVGEYVTSLEMAGASISFIKLDNELKELLSTKYQTPFIKN